MKYLRFILIPAVLFLLPEVGQADWFWQNPLPQGNPFWEAYFHENNAGYAVGRIGTIIKNADGGPVI
jgi:hypothetical protein